MSSIIFFCKNKKTIITAFFMAAFIIVFSVLFYEVRLSHVTQRVYLDILNYGTESETQKIENGDVYESTAVLNENLSAIGIVVNRENVSGGTLTLDVIDADGQLVASSTREIDGLSDHTFSNFELGGPFKENTEYTLNITPEISEGDSITLVTTEDGEISLGAYYERIGRFYTFFYFAFVLLCALICGATFILMKCDKIKFHTLTLIVLLLLGIMYNIILPPYSAPDEAFHINQAFNNSEVLLQTENKDNIYFGINFKRPSDNNKIVQDNTTYVFTYKELAENLFTFTDEPATASVLYEQEDVGNYEVPYFLSSFLVALARLLHLGFVPTLYLARLGNTLFYAATIYFAVKITPFGKSIMAVIALIPVSLHVATSFSRDGFIICTALLVFAMALRIAKDADISIKFCLAFLIIFTLFGPSKSTYIPLLLLVLMFPFKNMKRQNRLTLAVALPVVSLIFYAFTQSINIIRIQLTALINSLSQVESTAQVAVGESAQVATAVAEPIHPSLINYTLDYIFAHKGDTLELMFNTIVERTQFYIYSMFGGSLGYFNINISWLFVICFIILLLLAVQNTKADELVLTVRQKAVLFAASLFSSALVVAGCLTWTPITFTTIYGMQGRYFTPVLFGITPLLKAKYIEIKSDISKQLVFAAVFLNCCVLFNAFYVISMR